MYRLSCDSRAFELWRERELISDSLALAMLSFARRNLVWCHTYGFTTSQFSNGRSQPDCVTRFAMSKTPILLHLRRVKKKKNNIAVLLVIRLH